MAQQRFRYFSDLTGTPVELCSIDYMRNEEFAARFPGVKGMRVDGYSKLVGRVAGRLTDGPLPVTRKIDYKAQPSLHACNAKCLGGKVNGTCECQCGGRNHGAGAFRAAYREAA